MVCGHSAFCNNQPPSTELLSLLPLPEVALALQECRQSRDSRHGRRLHFELCYHGLEAHERLGNYLVPMLHECGCLQDAQNAFNKLTHRNEHAWTSLVQGCLDSEEPDRAFSVYDRMQDDRVLPTLYTFVPLLKSCCGLRCAGRACWLHSEIVRLGLDQVLVLGNSLLDMYVKCRSLDEAQRVFDLLPHQDVFSFNTLMNGYAENGDSEEVHVLYKQMLLMGGDLQPDACTFLSILNVCCADGDVHFGQEIHGEIIKEGFEEHTSLASKIVDFYARSGLLEEAQEVFDQLPEKDDVAWTALISGYSEHGSTENALNCYEHMLSAGVIPDDVTLVCVVKACGCIETIDKGREIHSQIVKQKGSCDSFLSNSLVCMYAKCGLLLDSKMEFDTLHRRDVVSWTALITGYADCGRVDEAFESFERMEHEGVSPNVATYTCIMQMCCNTCTLEKGQEVFREVVTKGLERDIVICNILLGLYIKIGFLEEAQVVCKLFSGLDIRSWNLLIMGFAEHELGQDVFACLERMQLEAALSPNLETYSCCLNFCATVLDIENGFILHSDIIKKGAEKDYHVCGALVKLYAECCSLTELESLFYKLLERDVSMWNELMQRYVQLGLCEEAFGCLECMYMEGVLPDVASWNILIMAFIKAEQSIKSLDLFLLMQAHALSPDGVILMSMLKACGELAALEVGKRAHAQCWHMLLGDNSELRNTLIHMYGKCGNMDLAQEVFDSSASKSLVTWNSLLSGYARLGASARVFHNFEKMAACYVLPDEVTFLSVLTACTHEGQLSRGQECFKRMVLKAGLLPNAKHYTCMVDQYGRAGHVDEIVIMVDKMPAKFEIEVWETILNLCQKRGVTKAGLPTFNALDDRNSTVLKLLSNMYTSAI